MTSVFAKSAPFDDIKPIIQEVELLSNDETNENNKDKVHTLLENAVNKYPENAELLWRLGKSFYDIASEKGKAGFLEEKKNLLYKGLGIVQKSVKINSQNASAQKWCAILLGSTSDYESTQDRILLGFKYKEHITKSIELNNKDATSYHLLGRWCYEVSQLPWWQRRAASAFIAEPPTSTVQEALENFLKAEELDPGFWLSNSYWIAKCYYDLSQYSQSKEWLQKIVTMKTKSEEDEKCLALGRELLQSL
ncbi:regulator of microtubule dynamics protein 2-like isoform X2 [Actinia tenebrosa]|uniref:Regulator of microtubule dynamics protein 1 n=1 Tax=Actinia tenebrosa TaxID=6105 RepID=A0A6P8HZT7_ACTTE|nr:regulator of microtubule dynamics protein 2-like isoform X2 [Actinia tenebrosa]